MPLTPQQATELLNSLGQNDLATVYFTKHALERVEERGITILDARHVIAYGTVLTPPQTSTRKHDNLYKYKIEGRSPNSGAREIGVVAVPSEADMSLKIVSVMWIDL